MKLEMGLTSKSTDNDETRTVGFVWEWHSVLHSLDAQLSGKLPSTANVLYGDAKRDATYLEQLMMDIY